MVMDLESLYSRAVERNPSYAKAFQTAWMNGKMSTEEYRNMLSQIITVKE